MRVWPNPPGLIVPDPASGENIKPGQDVERSQFIVRCLKSGDLVDVEPKIPEPSPKEPVSPVDTKSGVGVSGESKQNQKNGAK